MTVAVLATVTLSACNKAQSAPEVPDDVVVTVMDGYELQGDPKSAIEYAGNEQIFAASVVSVGKASKITRRSEDGDEMSYIYTPVTVLVDTVFKGDRAMHGKKVIIRAIGGQVGKEKTVSELNPAPEAYQTKMKLFLFSQNFVDAGDGVNAATPNFIFAEDNGGNVYNLHNSAWKTGQGSFFLQISEWLAYHS